MLEFPCAGEFFWPRISFYVTSFLMWMKIETKGKDKNGHINQTPFEVVAILTTNMQSQLS